MMLWLVNFYPTRPQFGSIMKKLFSRALIKWKSTLVLAFSQQDRDLAIWLEWKFEPVLASMDYFDPPRAKFGNLMEKVCSGPLRD